MCLGIMGDFAGSRFSSRFTGNVFLSKRGGEDEGEQFSFSLVCVESAHGVSRDKAFFQHISTLTRVNEIE